MCRHITLLRYWCPKFESHLENVSWSGPTSLAVCSALSYNNKGKTKSAFSKHFVTKLKLPAQGKIADVAASFIYAQSRLLCFFDFYLLLFFRWLTLYSSATSLRCYSLLAFLPVYHFFRLCLFPSSSVIRNLSSCLFVCLFVLFNALDRSPWQPADAHSNLLNLPLPSQNNQAHLALINHLLQD